MISYLAFVNVRHIIWGFSKVVLKKNTPTSLRPSGFAAGKKPVLYWEQGCIVKKPNLQKTPVFLPGFLGFLIQKTHGFFGFFGFFAGFFGFLQFFFGFFVRLP